MKAVEAVGSSRTAEASEYIEYEEREIRTEPMSHGKPLHYEAAGPNINGRCHRKSGFHVLLATGGGQQPGSLLLLVAS